MALASERAGQFYWADRRNRLALAYLQDARKVYAKWGAKAKVQQLEANYIDLVSAETSTAPGLESSLGLQNWTVDSVSSTEQQINSTIDLMSVLKSTRVISKEVILEKLLTQAMSIVMENAGAQRGALILSRIGSLRKSRSAARNGENDPWMIEVMGEEQNGHQQVHVMESRSLADAADLPVNFIRYVIQSSENVVLDSAKDARRFEKETYFSEHQTLSVLALPIHSQGNTIGVLYLENNLVAGAFTQERIDVLSLLAGQLAVSMDNALLYSTMEKQIADRTKEIRSILANVLYGIFSFEADLKVQSEYSAHLKTIFKGSPIEDTSAMKLLFAKADLSDVKIKQIESTLLNILDEEKLQYMMNRKALPSEYTCASGLQILELEWVPVEDSFGLVRRMMVTVRDVTEARQAAVQAKHQAQTLHLLGLLISGDSDRFEFFIQQSAQVLEESLAQIRRWFVKNPEETRAQSLPTARELAAKILRELHTLKGNARLYGLNEVSALIHQQEGFYADFMHQTDASQWRSSAILRGIEEVQMALAKISNHYDATIGKKKKLAAQEWIDMGDLLDRGALTEAQNFVAKKNQTTFRHMMEPLLTSLPTVAQKMEKAPPAVQFVGSSINLPRPIAAKLEGILNHLLVNSVSHGAPLEGASLIQIETIDLEKAWRILMSDNGRGLALGSLKNLGVKTGRLSEHSTDQEIAQVIFNDGVSSAETLTEFSGRGVGMAAVKATLEELGGRIEIEFIGPPIEGYRKFRFSITLPRWH